MKEFKWNRVHDCLPEENIRILGFVNNTTRFICYAFDKNFYLAESVFFVNGKAVGVDDNLKINDNPDYKLTHWSHIPKPKEEAENE